VNHDHDPVDGARRQPNNPFVSFMASPSSTRRQFLTTASVVAAAALLPRAAQAAASSAPSQWPIGCFNRPWTKWSFDEALDSIKAAGYQWTGLLSATKTEVLTGSAATPEYLASLKQKIASRGLKANMCALRIKNELPLADVIADTRKQIANAHTLGLQYALTFGEAKPERYGQYHKVMADAAAFGQERGIKVVMKPHGGGSGSSDEILHAIKAVGHPNFKIWYDAGNIIFYTGKDPVTELEPVAQHVTGFCAKDCGAQKGDVMIQFGTGKVDFASVFKKLKSAGFNGPIMVECCKIGATPQETTENARANRLFLEKVLASV
jgi:sugar phosphate isomerase/epimerase